MRIESILFLCVVALSVVVVVAPTVVSADPQPEGTITLQDLPPGYETIPAEDDGVDMTQAFDTLTSFRFADQGEAHLLWGKTLRLSPGEKRLAMLLLDTPTSVLQLFPAAAEFTPDSTRTTTLNYASIGDKSIAIATHLGSNEQAERWPQYGSLERTDVVVSLHDDVMAMMALSYPTFNPPDVKLEEIAVLLGKRIAGEEPAPASMPQPSPTSTSTPSPTATLKATATPAPTLAIAPHGEAAVAVEELKLRDGPGVIHDQIGTVNSGEELEIVGQSGACAWLQVKLPDGGIGWVVGLPNGIQYAQDCDAIPRGGIRPKTGTMARDFASTGEGKLRADNGSDHDGLVFVTDKSDKVLLVGYVRSGVVYTMSGIPDGSYRVYIATGDGWNEESRTFTNNLELSRVEGSFDYRTTRDHYMKWDISLHEVTGGEGVASRVPEEEFPVFE